MADLVTQGLDQWAAHEESLAREFDAAGQDPDQMMKEAWADYVASPSVAGQAKEAQTEEVSRRPLNDYAYNIKRWF